MVSVLTTTLAGGIGAVIGGIPLPEASPYLAYLIYGGAVAIALSVIGLLVLLFWKPKKKTVLPSEGDSLGDENTVVGTPPSRMGNRNTIINAVDSNGNTIINQGSLSIGAGAGFHPNGTIIGAMAGANLGKKSKD